MKRNAPRIARFACGCQTGPCNECEAIVRSLEAAKSCSSCRCAERCESWHAGCLNTRVPCPRLCVGMLQHKPPASRSACRWPKPRRWRQPISSSTIRRPTVRLWNNWPAGAKSSARSSASTRATRSASMRPAWARYSAAKKHWCGKPCERLLAGGFQSEQRWPTRWGLPGAWRIRPAVGHCRAAGANGRGVGGIADRGAAIGSGSRNPRRIRNPAGRAIAAAKRSPPDSIRNCSCGSIRPRAKRPKLSCRIALRPRSRPS